MPQHTLSVLGGRQPGTNCVSISMDLSLWPSTQRRMVDQQRPPVGRRPSTTKDAHSLKGRHKIPVGVSQRPFMINDAVSYKAIVKFHR
mmetsp:Transcript_33409/g.61536  ORF Transcript_33409/g.61536 Transcript_33409/m.61536 type:complete len:88 (+) Transcript_33409:260-523(+)